MNHPAIRTRLASHLVKPRFRIPRCFRDLNRFVVGRNPRRLIHGLLFVVCLHTLGCGNGGAQGTTTADSSSKKKEKPSAFTDVTVASGIDFQHSNYSETGAYRIFEAMTSGGAFLDYDGDGDLDLFLTQANDYDAPKPEVTSRLYRNLGGGQFEDVTESTGAGVCAYALGCAAADADNDGDPDMYITCVGPDIFLRNNGDGTFDDVTADVGLALGDSEPLFSSSAAWFDYNRDGFLDLYVARYCLAYEDLRTDCKAHNSAEREYCGPLAYPECGDLLFLNTGDGKFRNVTQSSGVGERSGYSFAVVASDFNNDQWLDLYVACDQSPALLWINQKNGTFRDQAMQLGAALNQEGRAIAGMGIAAEDFDRDGDFDLFITNLRAVGNLFLRNNGGTFDDASSTFGKRGWLHQWTGFGVVSFDQDHDGRLEMYVANGAVMRAKEPLLPEFPYHEPDQFLSQNEKNRFVDASDRLDADILAPDLSRGVVTADYDNDGDLDLLVCRTDGRPKLLRNNRQEGHWLMVSTVDRSGRGPILNAVVTIKGGGQSWVREVRPHQSYLTTGDPRVHFGLGDIDRLDEVIVHWPGGKKETWGPFEADQVITLQQGTGR